MDYFGLVVGIWSLCYLGDELSKKLVQNVRYALKDDGYFILNEPIFEDKDKVNRFHDITDQQLLLIKVGVVPRALRIQGLRGRSRRDTRA